MPTIPMPDTKYHQYGDAHGLPVWTDGTVTVLGCPVVGGELLGALGALGALDAETTAGVVLAVTEIVATLEVLDDVPSLTTATLLNCSVGVLAAVATLMIIGSKLGFVTLLDGLKEQLSN
ncbi:MAG: hypothetical protein HKL83_08185 [Acidimicrobiaceae bacterium]|nr:hypothetical protein [Acidimicrobiaceae bacterium]